MVIALSELKPEFNAIRHQILTSSSNPTMKDSFKRLLNMTGTHGMPSFSHVVPPDESSAVPPAESSALVSQASHSRGNISRNNNRPHP